MSKNLGGRGKQKKPRGNKPIKKKDHHHKTRQREWGVEEEKQYTKHTDWDGNIKMNSGKSESRK